MAQNIVKANGRSHISKNSHNLTFNLRNICGASLKATAVYEIFENYWPPPTGYGNFTAQLELCLCKHSRWFKVSKR